MKVRFIECMAGKDVVYVAGEVYDLEKKQAQRFIDHGICEKVIELKGKKKK